MALDTRVAATLIDGSSSDGWSTVCIFGRRLRKFSYWHRFLLRAADSPLLTPNKPVTFWDLRNAVGICSLAFPDSSIKKPWVVPALLHVKIVLKALFTRRKKDDKHNPVQAELLKCVERFVSYCGDYLQNPEYSVIEPETDPKYYKAREPRGRAIEELECLADLINFTKWDDKKIWNLPVGYANWLRAFALRFAGADISFVTDKEQEWREQLPEEFRVFKKGKE
jgi:hypothetical protein